MDLTVTLSANAGIALELDHRRIWVDAVHTEKQIGFSTLTPSLQKEMLHCEAFLHPEFICFTHCHGDHYSEDLVRTAERIWSGAQVILPEKLPPDGWEIEQDGMKLSFLPLPHEGAQYADTVHYGMMVSYLDRNILIPGDCALASPALSQAILGWKMDAVLLNFPWITKMTGRKYVQEHFGDCPIFVYHLPFSEDDCNGYRRAAEDSVARYFPNQDVRLLYQPFQTEKCKI